MSAIIVVRLESESNSRTNDVNCNACAAYGVTN